MYADHLLTPWLEALPRPRLFDCHTHIGDRDPSGFTATLPQLLETLTAADARAAVFPLKEPEGYGEANLRCIQAARDDPDRLVAFARVDAADRPLASALQALEAGARGIKLHPSSDEFAIDDPRLAGVWRLADERTLPVIVHAGPEVEGVGETALALCDRYPGARLILAHAALTDLNWIWREVDARPNLFFDTSWWGPTHVMAMFALLPPGRILSASDLPYCTSLSGALTTIRCGLQAGLSAEQLELVMGRQFERLVDGGEPLDGGPAPDGAHAPVDVLLERVYVTLLTGVEAMQRGEDPGNAVTVARHACKVPADYADLAVVESVVALLDLYEAHHEQLPHQNQYAPGWDLVAAAAIVARTPRAPVPAPPESTSVPVAMDVSR